MCAFFWSKPRSCLSIDPCGIYASRWRNGHIGRKLNQICAIYAQQTQKFREIMWKIGVFHGSFPHHAAKSQISAENPAGTDGFEFVEFAHPDPDVLRHLFTQMGYVHTATHKTRQIELWQQGDITYVLNADPNSFAARFVEEHGPCAPSMAWRVVDAKHAYDPQWRMGPRPIRRMINVWMFPPSLGLVDHCFILWTAMVMKCL